MAAFIPSNTPEQNRFVSIADFVDCVSRGGEIDLIWNGAEYGISYARSRGQIAAYVWNRPETTQFFRTAADVLEYRLGADRLRDVITRVTVLDRTI